MSQAMQPTVQTFLTSEPLWVEWHRNGKKKSEGNYKEGKQDGLWVWYYENGKKKYMAHFKDGSWLKCAPT